MRRDSCYTTLDQSWTSLPEFIALVGLAAVLPTGLCNLFDLVSLIFLSVPLAVVDTLPRVPTS